MNTDEKIKLIVANNFRVTKRAAGKYTVEECINSRDAIFMYGDERQTLDLAVHIIQSRMPHDQAI